MSRESAQRQVKSLEPFIISEASASKLLNFNEMASSPHSIQDDDSYAAGARAYFIPLMPPAKSQIGGKNLTNINKTRQIEEFQTFFSQLIFVLLKKESQIFLLWLDAN